MKESKISVFQLVVVVLLCRSFNLLSADILNVTGHYGMEHFLAIPLALLMQAIIVLPAFLLMKATGRGLTEATSWTLGKGGMIFPLVSCLYLFFASAITIYNLAVFLANAVYPGSSAYFFAITLVLAAVYAAWLGLEGIARSAVILAVLFVLSLLLTVLGVVERVNPVNIRPLEDGSGWNILKGAWTLCARSSAIYLYLPLSERLKSGRRKGFFWYLLCAGILMECVVFFVSTVLGELAVKEAYPFFMLTTVAQISIFQRMDALHVCVWVAVCFLRVTLFLWAMREQFVSCLPLHARENGRARWVLPFFALATLGAACGMLLQHQTAELMLNLLSTGIPILLLIVAIPLVCLLVGWIRGRLRKGESA